MFITSRTNIQKTLVYTPSAKKNITLCTMTLGRGRSKLGLSEGSEPLKALRPLGLLQASQPSEPHDLQSMRMHMIWRD